jgi:hypothetical protein
MVVLVGVLVAIQVPLELEFLVKETMVGMKPLNQVLVSQMVISVVAVVVLGLLVTVLAAAALVCAQALQAIGYFMLAVVVAVFMK